MSLVVQGQPTFIYQASLEQLVSLKTLNKWLQITQLTRMCADTNLTVPAEVITLEDSWNRNWFLSSNSGNSSL